MSIFIGQQPVVLRLPPDLAEMVSNHLKNTNTSSNTNIASSPSSSSLVLKAEVNIENLKKNYFYLSLDDKNFPAMLVDLPTKLETHKLFENSKLFKATDIGQMLQVFKTLEEREECRKKVYKYVSKGFKCANSGLSPPMRHVVSKKWLPTRSHGPYSKLKTAYVMEEIRTTQTGLQSDRDVVTIEDEIVDFEDWMVGGTTIKGGRVVPVGIHITITSESGSDIENHPLLLEHPEIFEQEWDDRDDDLLLGVDDIGDTLLPGYLELMDDDDDDEAGDGIDNIERAKERDLRLRLYSNSSKENGNNNNNNSSSSSDKLGFDEAENEDLQIETSTLRKISSTGDFSGSHTGNTDNTDALIDSIALASDDGNDDEGAMNMDVEENDFDHDNNSNRKVTFDSNGKLSQQILEVQDNKVLNNGRDGGIINLIEEEEEEEEGGGGGGGTSVGENRMDDNLEHGVLPSDSNEEDDSSDDEDGSEDGSHNSLLAAMEQELADAGTDADLDRNFNTTKINVNANVQQDDHDHGDDGDDGDDNWLDELEEDDLDRLASSPTVTAGETQIQGESEEP